MENLNFLTYEPYINEFYGLLRGMAGPSFRTSPLIFEQALGQFEKYIRGKTSTFARDFDAFLQREGLGTLGHWLGAIIRLKQTTRRSPKSPDVQRMRIHLFIPLVLFLVGNGLKPGLLPPPDAGYRIVNSITYLVDYGRALLNGYNMDRYPFNPAFDPHDVVTTRKMVPSGVVDMDEIKALRQAQKENRRKLRAFGVYDLDEAADEDLALRIAQEQWDERLNDWLSGLESRIITHNARMLEMNAHPTNLVVMWELLYQPAGVNVKLTAATGEVRIYPLFPPRPGGYNHVAPRGYIKL